MSRRALTDAQWARIEERVSGRAGLPGRGGADNRLFVDAVLWLARTASPWRALPPELGRWTAVHAPLRRWAISGMWGRLFNMLADPSRAIQPPLDPALYAVRYKVEHFFPRIKRFRRVALHFEKTLTGFMGFIYLIAARDWIGECRPPVALAGQAMPCGFRGGGLVYVRFL